MPALTPLNWSETFSQLFRGRRSAYGVWSESHGARTVKNFVELSLYQDHLNGVDGLGIIPINEEGLCYFAAIDVDVYDLDHLALAKKILSSQLPLTLCKSKSGGAHLYTFIKDGISAGLIKELMKRWASRLGFSKVEIFPKQSQVGPDNIGNWINLPYFNHEETTRYAVTPTGMLSLEQFIKTVQYYTPGVIYPEELSSKEAVEYPPCLLALSSRGLPDGARNSGLFNFGVFFKKSDPTNWEQRLMEHNLNFVKPPLPFRELQSIVRSLSKTTYQYTCEQEPICSHCDYDTCVKLPFGVSNMPWRATSETVYHPFKITYLRRLNTDPPRFLVEVNGTDVGLSSEELLLFKIFRVRVMELMSLVIKPVKQVEWEKTIKNLLDKREEIEAPPEITVGGQLNELLHDFGLLSARSKNMTDLLRDMPVRVLDDVVFRGVSFKKYLLLNRINITDSIIFMALKEHGCESKRQLVDGRYVQVWSIPWSSI